MVRVKLTRRERVADDQWTSQRNAMLEGAASGFFNVLECLRSTPAESGKPLHRSRASGYNTGKVTRVLGCTAVVNGPPSTFLMPAVYQLSSIHGMGKFH